MVGAEGSVYDDLFDSGSVSIHAPRVGGDSSSTCSSELSGEIAYGRKGKASPVAGNALLSISGPLLRTSPTSLFAGVMRILSDSPHRHLL